MFKKVTASTGRLRALLRLAAHREAQAERLANAPRTDPSRQVLRARARREDKMELSYFKERAMGEKVIGGSAVVTRASLAGRF